MENFEIFERELPAYWAPAIINGDTSGMSDAEMLFMGRYMSRNKLLGLTASCEGDTFFAEFDGKLIEMLTYVFLRKK